MAKIDLEKLICSLAKRKYFSEEKLQGALNEQGLEYKDGEIVEIQKPKFKVGDFIKHNKANLICKVISVNSNSYYVENIGTSGRIELFNPEQNFHLWTIQDVKDGDVLADEDNNIGIYRGKVDDVDWHSYIYLGRNNYLYNGGYHIIKNTKPATKEQRDLLFAKMKEAGYEWDADKKELKKIGDSVEKALRKAGYEWSEDTHQLKKIENTRPMLSDFFNAEYERRKASFANRQLYNRAILKILSDYIEKYPDTRFGQMLYNLGIGPVFNEESQEIYLKLDETINKQNHE